MATTKFLLTLILPGLVPAMAVAFALPLVILGGRGPLEAIALSVRRLVGAPLAFTAYTLASGAMMTVSLVTPYVGMPLLIVSSAWSLTTGYVAYRDLFAKGG